MYDHKSRTSPLTNLYAPLRGRACGQYPFLPLIDIKDIPADKKPAPLAIPINPSLYSQNLAAEKEAVHKEMISRQCHASPLKVVGDYPFSFNVTADPSQAIAAKFVHILLDQPEKTKTIEEIRTYLQSPELASIVSWKKHHDAWVKATDDRVVECWKLWGQGKREEAIQLYKKDAPESVRWIVFSRTKS